MPLEWVDRGMKLGYITHLKYICSGYPTVLSLAPPLSHMVVINIQAIIWGQWPLCGWLGMMVMRRPIHIGDCAASRVIHMI